MLFLLWLSHENIRNHATMAWILFGRSLVPHGVITYPLTVHQFLHVQYFSKNYFFRFFIVSQNYKDVIKNEIIAWMVVGRILVLFIVICFKITLFLWICIDYEGISCEKTWYLFYWKITELVLFNVKYWGTIFCFRLLELGNKIDLDCLHQPCSIFCVSMKYKKEPPMLFLLLLKEEKKKIC